MRNNRKAPMSLNSIWKSIQKRISISRLWYFLLFLIITTLFPMDVFSAEQAGMITGERKLWHTVTITFDGPTTDETAAPNPFMDYRLNVVFTNGDEEFKVPGYYAADGNASETGATAGNKWRVKFTPNKTGTWKYTVSFRQGDLVAISLEEDKGAPVAFDGASGSFNIEETDKKAPDFRSKGRLQYVGEHYLQHQGSKEHFIRIGLQSPENLFAYADFDGTKDYGSKENDLENGLHKYEPHIKDWKEGNPTWQNGKGKGIIGAINYLSGKGINGMWSLTFNYQGDGSDICPWIEPTKQLVYDCSKLDQWDIVISHMESKGILWHAVTQEEEMDSLLQGYLSKERKLYYRELVARFSHHLGIEWDIGEEIDRNFHHDINDIKSYCDYLTAIDPYKHPKTFMNFSKDYNRVFDPLLGYENFHATALQIWPYMINSETRKWVDRSAKANHKWLVCIGEENPIYVGILPDEIDPNHDMVRHNVIWGNLMAGGAGIEMFFGYPQPNNDMDTEDFRCRDKMYTQMAHAHNFFMEHLPFTEMHHKNDLTPDEHDFAFVKENEVYVIYIPNGGIGMADIDLSSATGKFRLSLFDPIKGTFAGEPRIVKGGGIVSIAHPPNEGIGDNDWVVYIRR